jgi:hypothetical protein
MEILYHCVASLRFEPRHSKSINARPNMTEPILSYVSDTCNLEWIEALIASDLAIRMRYVSSGALYAVAQVNIGTRNMPCR